MGRRIRPVTIRREPDRSAPRFPSVTSFPSACWRCWCRELWMKSLGLKAVLLPPEEKKDVKTKIHAAKAVQERKNGKG